VKPVLKPLISGPSMPPGPVTPPPGSSTTRGGSHAGPEGQRPHCGATKTATGGRSAQLRTTAPLAKLTASETHHLDRAIVALSVNPELGTEVPGTLLRDYADEIDGVRVIYYVTALRIITIVAYVEA
jgi:hypothetical protein